MAKRKKSLLKNIGIGILVVALIGGAAVGTTMLVKNWDAIVEKITPEKPGPETELESYRSIDFTKNDKNGVEITTNEGLVNYFNQFTVKGSPVFQNYDDFSPSKVYRGYMENEGSLKLGSASSGGEFTLNTNGYSFDNIRVTARAYSAFNQTTLIYSCDEATLSEDNYQDAGVFILPTNAFDNTKRADKDSFTFEVGENWQTLSLSSYKRVDIYKIELWNSSELPAPVVE